MGLNIYPHVYADDFDRCPCDLHFAEFMEQNIENKIIFHFGTGAHHIIAKRNIKLKNPNKIFAVTLSVGEYESYMQLISNDPHMAKYYKVMFADIYTLSNDILPKFDVVNLFHLCEYAKNKNKGTYKTIDYGQMNDEDLTKMFIENVKQNGKLFLYKRSNHYRQSKTIIDKLSKDNNILLSDNYKTIEGYIIA